MVVNEYTSSTELHENDHISIFRSHMRYVFKLSFEGVGSPTRRDSGGKFDLSLACHDRDSLKREEIISINSLAARINTCIASTVC